MSEEEIIKILKEINIVDFYNTYTDSMTDFSEPRKYCDAIQGLLDLYNNEKEKYKRLSIEAQATAFDDQNKDTEGLLRVLLKQGEITLDEKGYYQRENFDWEENLYKLGLMKKKEKGFYIPDDECLDEYTKQLENQLKEYNEIKETFRKYCVMDNDTLYDGCCKMQDEIEELKDDNKKKSIVIIEYQDLYEKLVDKIKAKIEEYEEILKSPIIKDDYKREVEHIIRVLKDVRGKDE